MSDREPQFEIAVPILSVIDLERAIDWYARVLGFSFAWSSGEPRTLASVCRGRTELNLALRGPSGRAGASHVYFRVDHIDALWKIASDADAEVVTPIGDRAYGMRDFSILDESGNRLDFGEPVRATQPATEGAPAADVMKVFLPAKDFALSKRFYRALGFAQNWESEDLAELELGGTKLLLQRYYERAWAENFMVHIEVSDADAWARHANAVCADAAFTARVEGPRNEPWGYRVTYVHDPSGVLLRFSQPLARP